jgi:Trypsin-co-occurring domain 1
MSKLQAIQIDPDTIIYVEATDNAVAPLVMPEAEETRRGGAKGAGGSAVESQLAQSMKAIEGTIKTYTKYTLNAFRDAALAEVERVSLEFGVNVSGSGGVPYIAAGTVGCNIKVTVECVFPERQQPVPSQAAAQTQQPTPQPMPVRQQSMPGQAAQAAPYNR